MSASVCFGSMRSANEGLPEEEAVAARAAAAQKASAYKADLENQIKNKKAREERRRAENAVRDRRAGGAEDRGD